MNCKLEGCNKKVHPGHSFCTPEHARLAVNGAVQGSGEAASANAGGLIFDDAPPIASTPALMSGVSGAAKPFGALRIIAAAYRISAWCAIVGGPVVGLFFASQVGGESPGAGFMAFIAPAIYGALGGLTLLAVAEVIKLFLSIEENVRKLARKGQ